jgi:hypothetical protein
MPVSKKECKKIREVEGMQGGITYYITHKDYTEETALCFRLIRDPNKQDEEKTLRCANHAGMGTEHVGSGACKYHGGASTSVINTIKTGKGAVMTRKSLSDKIDTYLGEDSEKLFDLSKELAAMRAVFEEFMETFASPTDEAKYSGDLYRLVNLVGTVGTLVDKISRINSRNTLTSAQVLYIRATVADILVKYLRDPIQREMAVKELTSRVTGNELPDYNLVKREKWESVEKEE